MTDMAQVMAEQEIAKRFERRTRFGWMRAHHAMLLRVAGVVLWLGVWQLWASAGLVNVMFASSPARVASAFVSLISSGSIYSALGNTGYALLWGLLIAIAIGIPVGLAMGRSSVLYEMTGPLVSIFYSLPFVLFLPVMIFWFGLGSTTRIVIVIWAAALPLIINVRAGARNLAHDYERAAKAFCAPRFASFVKVALPASLPFILAGIRLAIGRALVGEIVAEFFLGSAGGLGSYVQIQSSNFDMDNALAGIAILAVAALLLNGAVASLERRFNHWGGSH